MNQTEAASCIRALARVASANISTSSFPTIAPTIIDPLAVTTKAVIDLTRMGANAGAGGTAPMSLYCVPIATASADDAFDMKVYGWRQMGAGADLNTIWIPQLILSLTCTVGSMTGVASSPVVATELFIDTIVLKAPTTPQITGWARPSANATPAAEYQSLCSLHSPADNTVAAFIVPTFGFQRIEFAFDQTTNTPACNILYALVGGIWG